MIAAIRSNRSPSAAKKKPLYAVLHDGYECSVVTLKEASRRHQEPLFVAANLELCQQEAGYINRTINFTDGHGGGGSFVSHFTGGILIVEPHENPDQVDSWL